MKRAIIVLCCLGSTIAIVIGANCYHNSVRKRALTDLEQLGCGATQIVGGPSNGHVISPEKEGPSLVIGDTYTDVNARDYPRIGFGIRIDAIRYPFEASARPDDRVFASIARFPELSQLDISGPNRISGAGLISLGPCRNLLQLQINNGQLKDENLKLLARLDNITFLSLAHQPISDHGMGQLDRLTKITELCLEAIRKAMFLAAKPAENAAVSTLSG